MDLNELLVFTKVVQAGSFIGASRELAMPKSTVSRKVSELEARLGARLLQRTTRKLSLTDVGQIYYEQAARVVAGIEEAELAVTRMQQAPRGLLRVTMPLNFGFLGASVASFMRSYPEVQVELVGTDRVVDLVQEGFDLAIRAGELADSTLIARSLGSLESYIVASPSFLRRHGALTRPEQLEQLDCLAFGVGDGRTRWRLVREGKQRALSIRARLTVNDFEFLQAGARAGLGLALLPIFRCASDLRTKRLQRVLPDWCSPATPMHAVYPSTRHLSPKLKVFLDHLQAEMTPPPWARGLR